MKRALVLSGGGAKGSYELGVYKALKRLGFKFDIITGTSIGSLNGALFTTNDYRKAKKLWFTIDSKEVFGHDLTSKHSYLKFAKDIITNKGLKFTKAEEIMSKYINEDKIRKSKIDYGLITYNAKTRTPKSLRKDDVPKGKMLSYIMASASCFPFVEMKKVDDEYLIDGGFYDNLPINLAIEMGADEIIAVDLTAIGIKQKVKDKSVKIDYIKTDKIDTFILDFNIESAKKNMRIGYNDTMKKYNKLDGKTFTFKKGSLDNNYNKVIKNYEKIFTEVLNSNKKSKVIEILKNGKYKNILSNLQNGRDIKTEINNSMEYLASIFDLDCDKIYSPNKFNKLLIKRAEELSYINKYQNLKGKMLIAYIYNNYKKSLKKEDLYSKLYNIALVFQKDFLAALYLIAIEQLY